MKHEQIEQLTIENSLALLISRILDVSSIEGPIFQLDSGEELEFYDKIIMHQDLVKPELERLEFELVQLKAELTLMEDERLAERARQEDLISRFSSLKDVRLGLEDSVANPAAYFRDHILKNVDKVDAESKLAAIEAKYAVEKVSADKKVVLNEKISRGHGKRKKAANCLAIVTAFTDDSGMDDAAVDAFIVQFADINTTLMQGRSRKAKVLITAVTDPAFADLKADLLEALL